MLLFCRQTVQWEQSKCDLENKDYAVSALCTNKAKPIWADKVPAEALRQLRKGLTASTVPLVGFRSIYRTQIDMFGSIPPEDWNRGLMRIIWSIKMELFFIKIFYLRDIAKELPCAVRMTEMSQYQIRQNKPDNGTTLMKKMTFLRLSNRQYFFFISAGHLCATESRWCLSDA